MPFDYTEEADLDSIFAGQMDWEGKVRYEAGYAMYVEYDTAYAGSKPPFEPIHKWVQRNWSEIHPAILDMTENENESITVTEHQKRVAWFLVEQIAESGIDGVHFGKRALDFAKANAESVVARYAGSDDPEAPKKIAEDITRMMYERSQEIIEEEANDTGALAESGSWVVQQGDG